MAEVLCALVTNSELLAKIDAAIDLILTTNQSSSVLGRTYVKAEIGELWKMRKEVVAALESDANGGGIKVKLVVLPP